MHEPSINPGVARRAGKLCADRAARPVSDEPSQDPTACGAAPVTHPQHWERRDHSFITSYTYIITYIIHASSREDHFFVKKLIIFF